MQQAPVGNWNFRRKNSKNNFISELMPHSVGKGANLGLWVHTYVPPHSRYTYWYCMYVVIIGMTLVIVASIVQGRIV